MRKTRFTKQQFTAAQVVQENQSENTFTIKNAESIQNLIGMRSECQRLFFCKKSKDAKIK